MTPLPKRKISHARQGERRQHLKLSEPALMECPQCHNPKPPHQTCPVCGQYKGREVIAIKTKEKKKPA